MCMEILSKTVAKWDKQHECENRNYARIIILEKQATNVDD